jgi:hypothetical protein
MEPDRDMKIASLGLMIALLQREELRLQSIISSDLTTPELREQTKIELSSILKRIKEWADELTRVQQEEP